MFKLLIPTIFLIGMISQPVKAENYTIDSSSEKWKIEINLNNEPRYIYHKVQTIYIDDENKEVIVLYPGDKKGVKYKFSQIYAVYFHNKISKITNVKLFNQFIEIN